MCTQAAYLLQFALILRSLKGDALQGHVDPARGVCRARQGLPVRSAAPEALQRLLQQRPVLLRARDIPLRSAQHLSERLERKKELPAQSAQTSTCSGGAGLQRPAMRHARLGYTSAKRC